MFIETMDANDISAIAAAGSAIAAALAVAVAYWSVRLSSKTLSTQERHNHLTVRPIPFLGLADYDDMLRVKISNDGSGPLIIKEVSVKDSAGTSNSDVISWMPPLPDGMHWSQFTSHIVDRAFLPGSELILLQLEGDPEEERFSQFRRECRQTLARLTVQLRFTDVYENNFDPYSRTMDWFARDSQGADSGEASGTGGDKQINSSGV